MIVIALFKRNDPPNMKCGGRKLDYWSKHNARNVRPMFRYLCLLFFFSVISLFFQSAF